MSHPTHIAAIRLPDPDSLSDETRAYFDLCREKLGIVPNVLLGYTISETKLRNFTHFYNHLMLGESRLSPLEREMIATVVSSCAEAPAGRSASDVPRAVAAKTARAAVLSGRVMIGELPTCCKTRNVSTIAF